MSEELQSIQGKFARIIFRHDSNAFTVAKFTLYELDEKNITVTGYLPLLDPDTLYNLKGIYKEHPKYGMQFQIESFSKVLASDEDSIIRYLSGPMFPGIGKKFALTIFETLGKDCLSLIKENPNILDAVPKMTQKKKEALQDGICNQDDVEANVEFFSTHGLGIRNIMRLDRAYGKEAKSKVSENPYRLIDEVDGIGFQISDKLALSMGFSEDDPRRLAAALVCTVMDLCMKNGDTYCLKEEVKEVFDKNFYGLSYDFEDILDDVLMKQKCFLEEDRLYHASQYLAERYIAQYLTTFPAVELDLYDKKELDQALVDFQKEMNISYDEIQIQAIYSFFENDALILTGGPGTGKTTVVQAMIKLFAHLYPNLTIACCAPTGRAAKRLAELTNVSAYTIHSLLQWDLETNSFGKNEEEPLLIDLLIIDEFSMVDNWLFYNLAKAGAFIKKICFIGDEDQLPSVSCGCLLRDLIQSELFPIVRLSRIYRQSEGSDVVSLSHQIKIGETEKLHLTGDVAFFERGIYDIRKSVLQIVENALAKGYDMNEIQVLSAKYSGLAGIDSLNNTLQACLNPHDPYKRELKVGYRIFREGDKILQLKNQPDDDVYNGDIGTLVEIIYKNEDENNQDRIIVDFDGVIVEYTPDFFIHITHAYCISIHKSQGSEYPIVIMPCVKEYGFMLQKRLVYTGITRARKSLILVGEKEALIHAIQTGDRYLRKTTLGKRIEKILDGEV